MRFSDLTDQIPKLVMCRKPHRKFRQGFDVEITSAALRVLDEDEKGSVLGRDPGGNRELYGISEPSSSKLMGWVMNISSIRRLPAPLVQEHHIVTHLFASGPGSTSVGWKKSLIMTPSSLTATKVEDQVPPELQSHIIRTVETDCTGSLDGLKGAASASGRWSRPIGKHLAVAGLSGAADRALSSD